MAFLRTFGLLGLEIRIFYCRAPCLVYLAMQPRRKPIFGLLGFSHSETGVSGWISRRSYGPRSGTPVAVSPPSATMPTPTHPAPGPLLRQNSTPKRIVDGRKG